MFNVIFVAVLGIGVLCAAQSDPQDFSQLLQGLSNNPELQGCYSSISGCAQTLTTELQSGNVCSSMRRYIGCAANACGLSSDMENAMLQLLGASLKDEGITCDFGNGGPSIKKSSLDILLLATMTTVGMMFYFRG
ncbi:hypothetical protein PoB_006886400 [Plakobranchus ocellatus]|uniref:Uncharacterized protein n=1 Tax=Plakobranchus ocellatus TaxID=259542 RepID=A0AAV4DDZ8_9GAST|nr:hypothetical protein PoB_006886400 [Plakobranchus ocellatus]